jgi:peptidyl-tRNA hydrolase, PTH1 family
MKLIVGLGNPGKEYEKNRHNVGFMVIDQLAKDLDIKLDKTKFDSIFYKGVIEKEKVILLKPQTYMNSSGKAVAEVMKYYDIALEDILIVYDDKDLTTGQIRIRMQGSGGTQNGMINVVNQLKTQHVTRMRIGIDQDLTVSLMNYVLSNFSKKQKKDINEAIKKASHACLDFIKHDAEYIMNNYNSK